MAHVKAGGTTKGNRDSRAKRLGVKLSGGQSAKPGSIILRQRGSQIHAGKGVKTGRDYTLFAIRPGVVHFGMRFGRKFVSVEA